MADWNRMLRKSSDFGVWCSTSSEEFQEEEVWGDVVEERSHYNSTHESCSSDSSSSSAWSLSTAPRTIVKTNDNTRSTHEASVAQKSAPLNIPDWSKIVGKNVAGHDGYVNVHGDDDEDDEVVPPHEWMARKLARSQISSFSVVEGRGRKLRGRDLRKVRNAVLTKTGFIES